MVVVTDGEIVKAASDLTMTGKGATTEELGRRFGVDPIEMTERLMLLESRGALVSVALSADEPGMGHLHWVRPGEAALYFSHKRYEEFEARVRALAVWKGYTLVPSETDGPPRRRRYSIEATGGAIHSSIHGTRLERALWKLRHLPPALPGEQPLLGASDVA